MITIRHMQRLFDDHQHRRLYRELIAARPEASFCALEPVLTRVIPIAALGLLRLDELSQASTTLSRRLLDVLLTSQQPDGGWSDPMITSLCLRALLSSSGHGQATARGLAFLSRTQKPGGIWSRDPFHRMPPDPFASAFILLQLGDQSSFRRSIRFDDAVDYFALNEKNLEPDTARLWSHAATRCRIPADRRDTVIHTLWTTTRPAA